MGKFLAFFGPVITVLALMYIKAAVSTKMFTQSWPVRKGLNIISCLEFEKAKELKKKVCLVAYNKYEPDGIHYSFIVGINLCGSSTAIQWNETMLKSEKYILYEGGLFMGIQVLKQDNNSKYFCSVHGPEYRESIQMQLIYVEENVPITHPSTTDPVTEGKKTAGENMPKTHPSTTDPVTEGKKTAGENMPTHPSTTDLVTEGQKTAGGKSSNESDSCLAWKAVFGTLLSTVAIILICYLLYLHGEWLLNAAHVHWERLRTAVQGLFGHHVIYRDEFRGESLNCKALTERPTTTDTFKVNCSGGPQTTSLGTEESYPLPQTFEQPADPL